jgi:Mg2+ and Co2+ transporter CorA
MDNVSLLDLAAAITRAVQEYTEDVTESIEKEVESTADKVLKEVKQNHPYMDRTGEYSKGFVKTNKSLPGQRRYVIWNKKHYRRVHLLEFGHAFARGGRARAYPHLRPAHDKYAGILEDSIKQIIKNGG